MRGYIVIVDDDADVRKLTGKLNKETAEAIGISEKTVKYHRANVLRKFAVRSIAELVRIANRLGIEPADSPHAL